MNDWTRRRLLQSGLALPVWHSLQAVSLAAHSLKAVPHAQAPNPTQSPAAPPTPGGPAPRSLAPRTPLA